MLTIKNSIPLLLFFSLSLHALSSPAVGSVIHNRNIHPPQNDTTGNNFIYINTSFENASPLDWEIDKDGKIIVSLVYDHERSSVNKTVNHWHFQVEARAGSNLTLILQNFDNLWNGQKAYPVSEKTSCLISTDGFNWQPVPTDFLPGNRIQFNLHMTTNKIYVASVEPYRLSDLDKFLKEIKSNKLIQIKTIGNTVEGRPLEIIRVGYIDAPRKIFIRARAHAWEPGGNWVVEGLVRSLLDKDASTYLKQYCIYILPMANKDAVARGRSRFNILGKDLNREWDKPADREYAPENWAFENWLAQMIKAGAKPDLAIDLHNDSEGHLHVSKPVINGADYQAKMKKLETLLFKHTWFTEGATYPRTRNPAMFGEGLMDRYELYACVYELNYEWIAGLKKVPSSQDWKLLGKQLRDVFSAYFAD